MRSAWFMLASAAIATTLGASAPPLSSATRLLPPSRRRRRHVLVARTALSPDERVALVPAAALEVAGQQLQAGARLSAWRLRSGRC